MEQQACEILIGVGIAAAVIGFYGLIRHLHNVGKSADADMKRHIGEEYDEETKR